jgi:hypothetical protein
MVWKFYQKRIKWAAKGTSGVISLVSLAVGALLALLVWFMPEWTKQHISDRMNTVALGLIPLAAGATLFMVRWILSAYFVFKDTECQAATTISSLREQLDFQLDKKREQQDKERADCFDRCAREVKKWNSLPIGGLLEAEAYKLSSNEQLVTICYDLKRFMGINPFAGFEEYVPEKDWLPFLQQLAWGDRTIDATTGSITEIFYAADEWRKKQGYPEPKGLRLV